MRKLYFESSSFRRGAIFVELKPGHRVCFCCKNGKHIAEVYDGASKRLLGEFDHPPDLTIYELEMLLVRMVSKYHLAVKRVHFLPGIFDIVTPQS